MFGFILQKDLHASPLPSWCSIYLSLFGYYPQNMDGPFYERVRLYYSRYAEAELEFCSQMVQELRQLQRDASMVRNGGLVYCAYCDWACCYCICVSHDGSSVWCTYL